MWLCKSKCQVAQPPQGERASAGEDIGCNLNLSDDLQGIVESVCGISSYQKDEDVDIQATQAHRSHEIIEIDESCAKRLLEKAHRSTFSFQWKLLDLVSSPPHSNLPQEAISHLLHPHSSSSMLLIFTVDMDSKIS
eukprot:scaffold4519_cov114-Skeletonema_dohrnii-CCMP3373.AAC.1